MSDVETELAALRAAVADLKAQVERAKPPAPFKPDPDWRPPINPIDRLSMPSEAMADMVRAIPDHTIRDIVKSGGVGVLQSTATTPTPTRVSEQNRSGWRDAQPLSNPPGVTLADKLVDEQDRRDRAELIAQEARRRLAEKG
jgi:hypothetical protein